MADQGDGFEGAKYEGVQVDLIFQRDAPFFGDLFLMLFGFEHPFYPPGEEISYPDLSDLEFQQTDDYWAIRKREGRGLSSVIWLYPLVGDQVVEQYEGMYTGLRISYDILRNLVEVRERFLNAIITFAAALPVDVVYRTRGISLGNPPDLAQLSADIEQVVAHWRAQGIEPGSDAARRMSF